LAKSVTILNVKNTNLRLVIICAVAASVGLSMALISIAKLLLLLCGLAVLVQALRHEPIKLPPVLLGKATPIAIMLALAAFAISLIWTIAPMAQALGALSKYGKLLIIIFILCLLRSRREALIAIAWFAAAQLFLVLSAWALYLGLSVPWATSRMAIPEHAVFSSYLDQGIISAVFALLCWHLRSLMPGKYGPSLAIGAGLLALGSVLFVLNGRSGHVVAIVLLSLAVMWELPKRFRALVVLLPFLIAALLFATSPKVRERMSAVSSEVQAYSSAVQSTSSSGVRLGMWRYAALMIEQHPLIGLGVGSWQKEFENMQRADGLTGERVQATNNPHQEYLIWGVQLGVPGLLLFLAFMLSMLRDSLPMAEKYRRAVQTCVAGFAVACMFNASLFDGLIGDFFCVSFGLVLALGANYKVTDTRPSAVEPPQAPKLMTA
jgi:O-antigen ligase